MAIVSDANILSSLAAADALDLLPQVFVGDDIFIPQAVQQELQAGLTYGKSHLNRIFQAISLGEIQVLHLTAHERALTIPLPRKLHAGEREGIILCQVRKHLFLSNDKRATRYCQANWTKSLPHVVVAAVAAANLSLQGDTHLGGECHLNPSFPPTITSAPASCQG